MPTSLHSARTCRLTDLELFADAGPAAGNVFAIVWFHNLSATPCQLRGIPQLELLDDRGTVWQSNGASDGMVLTTVVLVPNSWAASSPIGVGASCGGSGVTTKLRVRLPLGSQWRAIPLPLGTPGPSHCGGGSSAPRPRPGELGVPPIRPLVPPSGTGEFVLFDALTPSLQAPRTVHRGDVLRYLLVLTSSGQSGVGNELCPLYDQHLSGIAGGGSYELRCDVTVNLEAPGDAVAYDLQLAVPADARTGPTTLSLTFLEPALPAVTSPITVLP